MESAANPCLRSSSTHIMSSSSSCVYLAGRGARVGGRPYIQQRLQTPRQYLRQTLLSSPPQHTCTHTHTRALTHTLLLSAP